MEASWRAHARLTGDYARASHTIYSGHGRAEVAGCTWLFKFVAQARPSPPLAGPDLTASRLAQPAGEPDMSLADCHLRIANASAKFVPATPVE